jgi:hypothetical protein
VVMAGGELGIKLVFWVTRDQTCWAKGQFRKRCRPVSGRVRHSGQIGSLGQPSSADYQLLNSGQAQLTRRKIDTLEGHQSPWPRREKQPWTCPQTETRKQNQQRKRRQRSTATRWSHAVPEWARSTVGGHKEQWNSSMRAARGCS